MQQEERKHHCFSGTCLSSRRLSNVLYPRKGGGLEHRQGGFQPAQSSARASAASKASQEAPAGKGPAVNVSSVKYKENQEVWVHCHCWDGVPQAAVPPRIIRRQSLGH